MYARHFTFKATSSPRPEVEAIADQVFGFMKSLPGFISVHFLVSEDEQEYGTFSLWESKQNAESAGEALRENTKDALARLAVAPSTQQVLEVYKPKS